MSSSDETDADRLRRLFETLPISKKQFAQQAGLPGGSSMLSQHLSGHRPVAVEAAIAYARGFAVSIDAVSPAAAEVVRQGTALLAQNPAEGISATEVQGVPQMNPKWPFESVSPEQWDRLSERRKGMWEQKILDDLAMLPDAGKRRRA